MSQMTVTQLLKAQQGDQVTACISFLMRCAVAMVVVAYKMSPLPLLP